MGLRGLTGAASLLKRAERQVYSVKSNERSKSQRSTRLFAQPLSGKTAHCVTWGATITIGRCKVRARGHALGVACRIGSAIQRVEWQGGCQDITQTEDAGNINVTGYGAIDAGCVDCVGLKSDDAGCTQAIRCIECTAAAL